MHTLDLKQMEILREFVRKNRKRGVIGFSRRVEDGKIIIYTEDTAQLRKLSIPDALSGFQIEFREIGRIRALGGRRGDDEIKAIDRTDYFDPLVAGISVGHYRVTAGTLGWFGVIDDHVVIISNNHVLAWENKGKIGDEILQPGSYDLRRHGYDPQDPRYVVAHLLWWVPIQFESYTCPFRNLLHTIKKGLRMAKPGANHVDLAVASIKTKLERELRFEILGLDGVNGWALVKVGTQVVKSGRTTGVTRGKVMDTHYSGYVYYSRGTAWFEDQILVKGEGKPFCQGGDSGSLVLTEANAFAGLVFAGSGKYGLVNPAKFVLEHLRERGIKMVGVDA